MMSLLKHVVGASHVVSMEMYVLQILAAELGNLLAVAPQLASQTQSKMERVMKMVLVDAYLHVSQKP
jgi:hypothetical protein